MIFDRQKVLGNKLVAMLNYYNEWNVPKVLDELLFNQSSVHFGSLQVAIMSEYSKPHSIYAKILSVVNPVI